MSCARYHVCNQVHAGWFGDSLSEPITVRSNWEHSWRVLMIRLLVVAFLLLSRVPTYAEWAPVGDNRLSEINLLLIGDSITQDG
jgi:hypothetical protein